MGGNATCVWCETAFDFGFFPRERENKKKKKKRKNHGHPSAGARAPRDLSGSKSPVRRVPGVCVYCSVGARRESVPSTGSGVQNVCVATTPKQ